MKKTFQKTLLAAAAGVALMGAASANSLLFPYWTTATGAQSVLSIVGNNNIVGDASGREQLHYVYNYGDTCTHFDGWGSVTKNDLMQHSVAAPAAGGFGKAVAADASNPFYFPSKDSKGFLVVSSMSTPTAAPVISGEMIIVDPSTGMAASYQALNNYVDTTVAGNEGNFSMYAPRWFNFHFFGPAIANTSYYAVVVGNMSARIAAGKNWDASVSFTNNGVIYNNDENPLSGTKTKRITCAGVFTPADLMNTAQSDALGGNGGLIHSTAILNATDVDGNPITPSTGAYVMKMQQVQAAVGAPFAGKQFLNLQSGGEW